MAGALRRERRCQRSKHAPCLDDASSDTTTTTTTGIHATDQLLVSTTPFYAHLSPLLLRARRALQDLDSTAAATAAAQDLDSTRSLRRLPRPGGTELRHAPLHCSRDLGHGPSAGSGHLPRLPPPTCSRPVSGVGLGPFCYAASLLRSPGPRPPPLFRSAIYDCLSLNVSSSLHPVLAHDHFMTGEWATCGDAERTNFGQHASLRGRAATLYCSPAAPQRATLWPAPAPWRPAALPQKCRPAATRCHATAAAKQPCSASPATQALTSSC
jgi:hypothetical protein